MSKNLKRKSERVALNTSFSRFVNKPEDPLIIDDDDEEINANDKAIVVFSSIETTQIPSENETNFFTKSMVAVEELSESKETDPLRKETVFEVPVHKRKRADRQAPKKANTIRVHRSIRTRMSPKMLFNAIHSLNNDKKKVLREIGFGSMVEMKVDGIPAKLGHYVVDSFDPKTMRIHLKNGYISVTKEAIHDMIGVPIGGTKVHSLPKSAPRHPLIVQWKSQFGNKQIRPGDILRRIVISEDTDILFKLNFLLLFVNTMSETKKAGICNLSILTYISHEVDISSLDWCDLILDGMKKSKKGWMRTDDQCYYTGPLTVLTLLYLDATKCINVPVLRQRPAIKAWNVELMRSRELAEIESGGFGGGELLGSFEEATRQGEDIVVVTDNRFIEQETNEQQTLPKSAFTDVEDYLLMIESKVKIIIDEKRKVESALREGLSSFPNNESLNQWVDKLRNLFVNTDLSNGRSGGQHAENDDDYSTTVPQPDHEIRSTKKSKEPESVAAASEANDAGTSGTRVDSLSSDVSKSVEDGRVRLIVEPRKVEMETLLNKELQNGDNQAVWKEEVSVPLNAAVHVDDAKLLSPTHERNNGSNVIKQAIQKIKFLQRRVSAVRSFPPYCGLNAADPTEEERIKINNLTNTSRRSKANVHASLTPKKSKKRKNGYRERVAYTGTLDMVARDEEDFVIDTELQEESPTFLEAHNVAVTLPPFGPKSSNDARNKVRETLRLFQALCRKLLQGEEAKTREFDESKPIKRVDLAAKTILQEKGKALDRGKKTCGPVPGVEVGDEFQYRVELALVGVHWRLQEGIDYVKQGKDFIAVSVVASGGYDNELNKPDCLIYSGSGGIGKDKKLLDQKLERGNLALKNNILRKLPVRVIRGYKGKATESSDSKTYIYDGLYTVDKYWREPGPFGNLVYKFELRRIPGQPELALREVKSKKFKIREGLCVDDITGGKEVFRICAVNTIDNEKPPSFNYITKIVYPNWYHDVSPKGCDCVGRCSDKKCSCAFKNGGEIPYNHNGAIVEAKPLVYECGPSCRCPPSCYNRVTQHGMKIQFEIFKTESRGWGVRSLSSISSGSFICEYIGELLEDTEAEKRTGNDEYLFDIGQNYNDCSLNPDTRSSSGGFTIDAANYGNVGRFINHSCSPNLYAQNVLYDQEDERMPHIMFFAAENIPPLQELTYHYNYAVDTVLDSDGNIKIKNCYCGSSECTGRLY